ncbi:MAG: ATP phosphoribosyltransferase regulatory subunit, partial [bacterium]|nr:ATP phosphoribosyltransferase regulatory subunit [bacterium]
MQYERVKGTYDMLPEKSLVFKQVQSILSKTMESYGFLFSRTSVLQPMEMFRRAVGGETDIVNKEMFSIKSKSGKEYVLKPEETAPLMRAVIEENFIQGAKTAKLYYFNPLYRHERPQK